MKKNRNIIGRILLTFLLLMVLSNKIWAADETFITGSYIIDMGQATQNVAKGLKPYGLVYTLIKDHSVPVRWSINPAKVKDGRDFTYNGKDYKGGTFIIPAEYVNAAVLAKINTWKTKGVIVDGPTTSSFVAPVYSELTSWPRAVLDDENGDKIVDDYYISAEIPAASYVLKGNPTMLTGCDDVYVLPHADPDEWIASWKTALDNYLKNNQGYLWSACHAVSALEAPTSAGGSGLPFLSSTGLVMYDKHNDGNGTYTYNPAYDADPIMQFMGKLDAATQDGSEQIYIPIKTTGSWRPTTKVAVYQPTHSQANPNQAAVLVYGHAYGNSNYGMVMYEAGHDHLKKTDPANIAAVRAYFNFILMAGVQRQINITTNIPPTIASGSTISLNATTTNGTGPFTYQWSSTAGGTFTNPTSGITNFIAPSVSVPTSTVIKVFISDNCSRFSYHSEVVILTPLAAPTAMDDMAETDMNVPVNINVLENDVAGTAALNPASVTFVAGTLPNPTTQGTFTVNPTSGLVTFTPVNGFVGNVTVNYQVCDLNALCDVATIGVVVNLVAGPTANDDSKTGLVNTPIEVNILENDVQGAAAINPASISFVGTPPNPTTQGTFSVNPTGIVTFTPVTGFYGPVTIDYEVCDLNNLCDIATISVNVIVGISNLYPALGPGTLAFEDLWPSKGDYDFNDLVIDYQFEIISNNNNNIEQVIGTFVIKAIGATLHNGFGFQLSDEIDPDDLTVTGYQITGNSVALNSNGTEAGQSKPTIIVYDDSYKHLIHPGVGLGVNTTQDAPYVTPVTITVIIDFTPNTYSYNVLDISNFNPFIFINQVRSIEVHLPNYPPTDLADTELFGTFQDDSNPTAGRYYLTENNLPWAINIYERFDYPIEKQEIIGAHLKFADWATSGGNLYNDWYKDLPGYRNNSLIYQVPGKK